MKPRFTAIVHKEFIERRNEQAKGDSRPNPYFYWDSEFVEHHQALVNPAQTLVETWEYDCDDKQLGRVDYKQYAKAGVKVSHPIQGVVKRNGVDKFIIWQWTKGWKKLEVGMEVEYDILGVVNAQEACTHLKHDGTYDQKGRKNMRFPFPLPTNEEFELQKAIQALQGTRMDDNYHFFAKK